MQDGAFSHTLEKARIRFENNDLTIITQSARFPDLNNWKDLGSAENAIKIEKLKFKNEIKDATFSEFESIINESFYT